MSKLRILCLAAAFALSASAASPMKKVPMGGVSGWGVGYYSDSAGLSSGGVQLDYKASDYEAGLTGSGRFFDSNEPDTDGQLKDWNAFRLGGFIGSRSMIKPNLALSAGFEGGLLLVDRWSNYGGGELPLTTQPYSVGFYSQMSYEPTKYLSTWARISLVDYKETGVASTANVTGAAENVRLGMSYYWTN